MSVYCTFLKNLWFFNLYFVEKSKLAQSLKKSILFGQMSFYQLFYLFQNAGVRREKYRENYWHFCISFTRSLSVSPFNYYRQLEFKSPGTFSCYRIANNKIQIFMLTSVYLSKHKRSLNVPKSKGIMECSF